MKKENEKISLQEKMMFLPFNNKNIDELLRKKEIAAAVTLMKEMYPKGMVYEYAFRKEARLEKNEYEPFLQYRMARLKPSKPKRSEEEVRALAAEKGLNCLTEGVSFDDIEELKQALKKTTVYNLEYVLAVLKERPEFQTEEVFNIIMQNLVTSKTVTHSMTLIEKIFPEWYKETPIYQKGLVMATGRFNFAKDPKNITSKVVNYVLEHLGEYDLLGSAAHFFCERLPDECRTEENALICCKGHFAALEELPEEYQTREFYEKALVINPYSVTWITRLNLLDEELFYNILSLYPKDHQFSLHWKTTKIPDILCSYRVFKTLAETKNGHRYIPEKAWDETLVRTAITIGGASLGSKTESGRFYIPKKFHTREIQLLNWECHPYFAYRETDPNLLADDTFWKEVFELPEIGKLAPIPNHLWSEEIADRITLEGGWNRLPKEYQTVKRAIMLLEEKDRIIDADTQTEEYCLEALNYLGEDDSRTRELFFLPYELAKKYVLPYHKDWGWVYEYRKKDLIIAAIKDNPEDISRISLDVYLKLKEMGLVEDNPLAIIEAESCKDTLESTEEDNSTENVQSEGEPEAEPEEEIDMDNLVFCQLSIFDLLSA